MNYKDIILQIQPYLPDMSFDFVLSVLAIGYMAAGILLVVNLHRNGFLKGNILGISASVIFITTATTYAGGIFLRGQDRWVFWAQSAISVIAVAAIYGFIIFSFKNRFIIGGYRALAAARKQLQQQENWMKLMQENMADGLAVFSPLGKLLYINPAAVTLLDVSEAQIYSQPNMMFGIGNKSAEHIEAVKNQVLQKQEVNEKIVFQRHGEHEKVLEVKLSPVYNKLRRVIAIAATYRDITDIYELERAKEEFIQIASHELRTPLTAVRGFLSLLQSNRYGEMSGKQKEIVEKAGSAATRLSKLVDNLLVVARIEESRISYNPEIVNMQELVNGVVQELTGEADRCSISIKVVMPANPLSLIMGDREKLQQVITNLIGNAIKYTPEGGHVYVEGRNRGDHIELSVTDTGVGIAKHDLEKLFHKFERIKNNRSVRVGGSGLGLVIVKSYTELHGGRVSVSSIEGQGSTFTLSLPVQKTTERPAFSSLAHA